jgi:hypothetical protein
MVKRTMKALSIREVENAKKLDFMVPMNINGRFQILTKLKDLTVDIDEVIVKPVKFFPTIIRKVEAFFSVDGYSEGNFMAYGTGLSGKETILWDDVTVEDMTHYDGMVDTGYIKRKLDYNKPVTLITATKQRDGFALVFHCYIPK